MKTEVISPSPAFEALLTQGQAPDSPSLRQTLAQAGLQVAAEGQAPDKAGLAVVARGGVLHLRARLELLDADAIAQGCDLHGQAGALRIYRLLGSTNDEARTWLGEAGEGLRLVLAEAQTAGRGRRGRRWVSPFGRNVYVSIGRHMQRPAEELGGLSLVMGMQLVESLRSLGLAGAGLKWPNDLLLDGGKAGGILVELMPREARGTGVIAGIGVNLALSEQEAQGIDQPWSQVSAQKKLERNSLAAALISRVAAALAKFDAEGFAGFQSAWAGYNLYQNTQVTVSCQGKRRTGIDRGVTGQGDLLLETADGMMQLNAGEVSLRPQAAADGQAAEQASA